MCSGLWSSTSFVSQDWDASWHFTFSSFYWGFQQMLWSIITPRNVFTYTLSIFTPSIFTSTWLFDSQFPNNLIFVVLKWNDHWFLSKHLFNLLISDVINFRICCKSKNIFVSSANNTNFPNVAVWHVSLMSVWREVAPTLTPGGLHKHCPNRTTCPHHLQTAACYLESFSAGSEPPLWYHTAHLY